MALGWNLMSAGEEPSNSLTEFLAKAKVPVENHRFIREFTNAVGIAEYRLRGDYIEAVRRDGGPPLYINWGFTNGFTSQEEIDRFAGSHAGCAPSSRKGTWYVAHPVNKVRAGSARSRDTRREAGFCDCGMQLSLTGVCSICD
jgi:hypothetical protein